jgi:hypothetical protein
MASKQSRLSAYRGRKAEWHKADSFTLSLVGMDIAVFLGTREPIEEGEGRT